MSIRTVIEINHDHLHALIDEVEHGAGNGRGDLAELFRSLLGASTNFYSPAIRVLGQRHHSETLKLEVKP